MKLPLSHPWSLGRKIAHKIAMGMDAMDACTSAYCQSDSRSIPLLTAFSMTAADYSPARALVNSVNPSLTLEFRT
jgi:hypothetical protein